MSTETTHGHEHHGGATGYATVPWSVAASATLHCLTGCAIGEVLGMASAPLSACPTRRRSCSPSRWRSCSATR